MKSSFNEAMMRSLCLLSKMVINACLCAFYSRPGKTAENSGQTTSSCNLPILARHVSGGTQRQFSGKYLFGRRFEN